MIVYINLILCCSITVGMRSHEYLNDQIVANLIVCILRRTSKLQKSTDYENLIAHDFLV